MSTSSSLKVWKTIQVGTGIESGEKMYSTLEKRGVDVCDDAKDVLIPRYGHFPVVSIPTTLHLFLVSPRDLYSAGGKMDYRGMCTRALIQRDLRTCPSEVGPQLRLQWLDQLYDGMVIVASRESLLDPQHYVPPFSLGKNGETHRLYLDAFREDPGEFWMERGTFVFCLPG